MRKLDLSSIPAYQESARRLASRLLAPYASAKDAEGHLDEINLYPGLDSIGPPVSVRVLEEEGELAGEDLGNLGKKAVLDGLVYWEHTAAGEATRLMMGPKFFITPGILERKLLEMGEAPEAGGPIIPLGLGRRHLAQLIYEIRNLAEEAGIDPAKALSRQRMLIIAAEDTMPRLLPLVAKDFRGLFPLSSARFMTQASFPGLERQGPSWGYAPGSPLRPHNHGAMVMQKAMDGQLFLASESGGKEYLTKEENLSELGAFQDLVSYNIEDLDYLTRALDFETIGLGLRMRELGHGMMMEIAANNPERPIKGGCCAHDPGLGRDVMIESFRLGGLGPGDIRFLNKNFNHYLRPADTLRRLVDNGGIFMPVAVRDSYVYFQPVQGDLNFLEDTVFFSRRKVAPLNSLKSPADISHALGAFRAQDQQPGFREFAEGLLG
ncbi:MAG: hypothetical protein LBF40_02465 [Deltaproteobacteria bacterium]|jgi:hypothetical protein|nr:hypothetical protein [Deltaproteobacteria bacterium]